MSVLLIGIRESRGEILVRRLLQEGDQVRVIEQDPRLARRWSSLGAYVATGSVADSDLIERAAQQARTIVVVIGAGARSKEIVAATMEGARLASQPPARLVLCADRPVPEVVEMLEASEFDYVVLQTANRRRALLPRQRTPVSDEAVADAISAADDMPGAPKLELDLSDPQEWATLKLDPP